MLQKHFLAGLVLLAIGAATPAWALPTTYATTYAYGNTNVSPPSPLTDSENLLSNSGAPLTSFSTMSGSNALWTLSAQSRAHVRPGLIQLYGASVASAYDDGPPSYVSAATQTSASARWSDSFTIDGGALNGTVGHLVAGFRVDGALMSMFDGSVNGSGRVYEEFRASLRLRNTGTGHDVTERGGQRHIVDHQGDRWLAASGGFPVRAPGLWQIAIDFKYGTPITLDMWGDIIADASAFACNSGGSATCSYSSSSITTIADFGHTLNWGGFLGLTDSFGNAVSNYSVASESGFDYRFAAAVPEPGTWMLLLVGIGLLGVAVRRRV